MKLKTSPPLVRPGFRIPSRLALITLALGATVAFNYLPTTRAADEPQPAAQAAADNTSYRLFYDQLGTDGDWFQSDDYGYVFQPHSAAQDKTWRPYTDGYWAQTDAGWTWVSNEDFGWACYHYGRWANLVDTGWVWIPGSDWSPAYVSWRVSKDHKHVGWAPLPPEAHVTKAAAIEGWSDSAYDVGPDAYTFIDTDHFGDDSYRSHLLPAEQNVAIFSDTENVTRIDYRTVGSQSVLYAGGPDVAIIRESSGRPVRELRLETRAENVDFFERGDHRRFSEVNGNQFVVATATVDVITSTSIRTSQPARINRRLSNVTVDRGYQGIRDPQQVERIRASIRSQSPRPPAQVEREASTAIHRNAPAAPLERNAAGAPAERGAQPGRNEAVPNAPRPEPTPLSPVAREGSPSPAPGRERPEASPATTPRREAAGSPTPSGEPSRNGRAHPAATPEAATPEPSPTRSGKKPEESPTPARDTNRGNIAPEHTKAPQASPTPAANSERPKANADERANGERSHQPGAQERPGQSATPSSQKREAAAPERESTPEATPRHAPGDSEEKKAKSEATPRSTAAEPERRGNKGEETPSRREEQSSSRAEGEKKAAPAGESKEHAGKPTTPPAGASEKEKATPKP